MQVCLSCSLPRQALFCFSWKVYVEWIVVVGLLIETCSSFFISSVRIIWKQFSAKSSFPNVEWSKYELHSSMSFIIGFTCLIAEIIAGNFHCSVQHGRWQPWWYDVLTTAATAATTTQFTRCIWWHGIKCSESTIWYDDTSERTTESSQFLSTETAKSTVIGLGMVGFGLEWIIKPCCSRNMVHKNRSKLFCSFLCSFGLSNCYDFVK